MGKVDTGSGPSAGLEKLAEAVAELVEIMVDEFDVHELLQVLTDRCVDVLELAASALMLADADAGLRVMVASNEQAKLLEQFQIQHDEGPGLESFRSGDAVVAEALEGAYDRWPGFAHACEVAGFSSVIAVPIRVTQKVIGTLSLFGTVERPALEVPTARVAQAMADVAAFAIEQDRLSRERDTLIVQLENALERRVAIEQAKGMLAHHLDIEPEEAFGKLRHRARSSRRLLTDVAADALNTRGRDYTAGRD